MSSASKAKAASTEASVSNPKASSITGNGDESKHANEPKPEGPALDDALKKQFEWYFSKENLATDHYLVSHMNPQKQVAVDFIADFPKVKSLCQDRAHIVKIMRQCKNLSVDDEGVLVRPNIKTERTTVILRDMPSDTTEEEVRKLFANSEFKSKVTAVRPDIEDQWFITFDSQDSCLEAAMWLNSQSFRGNPVRCRVKSENTFRGLATGAPADTPAPSRSWTPAAPAANGFYANMPVIYPPQYGYGGWQTQGEDYQGGRRKNRRDQTDASGQEPQDSPRKGKKGTATGTAAQTKKPRGPLSPPITSGHDWPALPSTPTKAKALGYANEFRGYDREKFADVFDAMKEQGEIARPATMPADCAAVRGSVMSGCELRDPVPIMYPASPSPVVMGMAGPASNMPFLDLSSSEPVKPPAGAAPPMPKKPASAVAAAPAPAQPAATAAPVAEKRKEAPPAATEETPAAASTSAAPSTFATPAVTTAPAKAAARPRGKQSSGNRGKSSSTPREPAADGARPKGKKPKGPKTEDKDKAGKNGKSSGRAAAAPKAAAPVNPNSYLAKAAAPAPPTPKTPAASAAAPKTPSAGSSASATTSSSSSSTTSAPKEKKEKQDKSEKTDKAEKSEKAEKPEKHEKAEKTDKSEKSNKATESASLTASRISYAEAIRRAAVAAAEAKQQQQ